MVEELFLAALVSLPVAAWTFYGIGLQGEYSLFWLTYYVTLSNGVGEWLQCGGGCVRSARGMQATLPPSPPGFECDVMWHVSCHVVGKAWPMSA